MFFLNLNFKEDACRFGWRVVFVIAFFAITLPIFAQDVEGSSDHPMIGRYQGAQIVQYEKLDYDEQKFRVPATGDEDMASVTLEGQVTRIQYQFPESASILAAFRSFEQQLESDGFEIVFACVSADGEKGCGRDRDAIGAWGKKEGGFDSKNVRVLYANKPTDTSQIHVQIAIAETNASASGLPINGSVVVLEEQGFENKMVDAETVTNTLTSEGKMAFYDIHFEMGSAELIDDSAATLALIAQVIAQSPELKVIVVGHTDNEGSLDSNINLSRARAAAVEGALVGNHEVDPTRISSAGVAFLAPVSTNGTETGRALNRRVEIVVR